MENDFDISIDFDTMSDLSLSLEKQSSQGSDLFEEISQDSQKKYLCTYFGCGKVFKYKSEISRHVIVHQNNRPYCCTYTDCRKAFKRIDALETHMQTHAKVLPYACDIPGCHKKFATKSAIRYHQIKHDDKRAFRCDFPGCNRTFLTSSQLKQHEKSYNVHSRCLELRVKEEEPLKIIKGEPQYLYQEFAKYESEPYPCFQWKIQNQNQFQNQVFENIGNIPERLGMISQCFAKQNMVQQEQFVDHTKWTNLFENKLLYEFQTCHQAEYQPTIEPSRFFDNNELKLLEFLKDSERSL